ncbi:MAG: hypothetical protein APR54_04210 [Candidatus Cloacimonas sp. SDB]|nr:MAG: hypothetical protein APR54_04210 [Candidatus Cloacimonas sp. SDB]
MRNIIIFILFGMCVFSLQLLRSITWIIDSEGSGDFLTIQEGINEADEGDTVIVEASTYYENIDYIGKNILIASRYLTFGDESYISETIIDGSFNGSVVICNSDENETAVLLGFTIQNGSGTFYSQSYYGGGIYCENSSPTISHCVVKNNCATAGGGVYIKYSSPFFKGVTITNNHAYSAGGGIYITHESTINFDENVLCNIYLNYAATGSEFSKSWNLIEPMTVLVDSFTVIDPDYYFISSTDQYGVQRDDISLVVQNAKIDPVGADLYVSPNGSNQNSGLSPEYPLKTINYAYSLIEPDSLIPHSINLCDGVYSYTENQQFFPLNLRGFVSLIGESMENTILDAEEFSSFIFCRDNDYNFSLKNLSFINGHAIDANSGILLLFSNPNFFQNRFVQFENLTFQNNTFESYLLSLADFNFYLKNVYFFDNFGGNQIRVWLTSGNSNGLIENMIIRDCVQYDHPDIFYANPVFLYGGSGEVSYKVTMKNVLISDNQDQCMDWPISSAAIRISNKIDLDLINCTIGNNITPGPSGAAVVGAGRGTTLNIINSILYGDVPREIYLANEYSNEPYTVNIWNSLVAGGEEEIYNHYGWDIVNWLDYNLDANPLWIGDGEHPFSLAIDSPCINGGTPDTTGLNLPEYDLAGNPRIVNGIVDMGAYEYQGSNSEQNILDVKKYRVNNFPNPFNLETVFSFSITYKRNVDLEIYNTKGQKIKTLIKDEIIEGNRSIIWDGSNNNNIQVSSGIYLYKLTLDEDKNIIKKCLLLK